MSSFAPSGVLTAILPCNNLDASERFYNRLAFTRSKSYWPPPGDADTYRLLPTAKADTFTSRMRSKAGSSRVETRSVSICISRTSTPWRPNSAMRSSG
jgi:hypothetical protein